MFIVYEKTPELLNHPNQQYLNIIGNYATFDIVEIDDFLVLNKTFSLKEFNAIQISEDEARCYIFMNVRRGYIKKLVVDGVTTLIHGSRDYYPDMIEDADPKSRYYITDEQKMFAVSLSKKIMRLWVENFFVNKLTSEKRIKHIQDRRNMLSQIEQISNWDECLNFFDSPDFTLKLAQIAEIQH